jgi:hypothetical protein
MESARQAAIDARREFMSATPELQQGPLRAFVGTPQEPIPGWDGSKVAWWRLSALAAFEFAITWPSHPYDEWMRGEVDLDRVYLDRESLTHFWLHEVDEARMPRRWLRSAFDIQQRAAKVTDGNPVDNQLGTYLVNCNSHL